MALFVGFAPAGAAPVAEGALRAVDLDPETPPVWLPWRSGSGRLIRSTDSAAACRRFAYARGLTSAGRQAARRDTARLIASWSRRIQDGDWQLQWLLAPMDERLGGSVRAGPRGLEVCVHRPTPDLQLRLAHPALRVGFAIPESAPFQSSATPGDLVRSTRGYWKHSQGRTSVAIYRTLDPGELAPILWVQLAEADLSRVPHQPDLADYAAVQSRREPTADRRYFLRLDPGNRWLADPNFRRWLGRVSDRQGLIDEVLGGDGSVDDLWPGQTPPRSVQKERRVFARDSHPHLRLAHDSSDPIAQRIAAALRGRLARAGVKLSLVATTATPSAPLTLSWVSSVDDDVVLRWLGIVGVGDDDESRAVLARLQVASRSEGKDARLKALELVTGELDANLLPLLVTRGRCLYRVGVDVGLDCGATMNGLLTIRVEP